MTSLVMDLRWKAALPVRRQDKNRTPQPGKDRSGWLIAALVIGSHVGTLWALSQLESTSTPPPAAPIEVKWIEPPPPEAAPEPPAASPENAPEPLPMAPAPVPTPPSPAPAVVAAQDVPSTPASTESVAPAPSEPVSTAPLDAPSPSASQGPAGDAAGGGNDGDRTAQDADYLTNPAPEYPLTSRLLGEEGRALVRALVDAKGLPLEVRLEKSSGHERLDRSAVAVVRRWKFRPASTGSKARSGWVVIPIRFSLRRS